MSTSRLLRTAEGLRALRRTKDFDLNEVMEINERPKLKKLSEDRCWELLAQKQIGRLAVAIQNEPDVFPVNYRIYDGMLFIRTTAGIKLAAAILGTAVAFEVDAIDEVTETGWSVVIRGTATELTKLDDLLFAEDLHITPWAQGPRERIVQIEPSVVTGREIPRGAL